MFMITLIPNRKVYIGRLDVSTTEHTLRQFLLDFGEVENVVIITDRETGDSRGFGFATFKDQAAADLACCKSGQEIDGNQVNILYLLFVLLSRTNRL